MAKHDYHWTFGKHCHIEFKNGGDPVVAPDHGFDSHEGSAAISDGNGSLLFYTDGDTLYDSAHLVIAAGLGGTMSSAHAAIIVPPSGGGSLYHVFTTFEWENAPSSLRPITHTRVAVTGGVVSVAFSPTPLTAIGPQPSSERLAAIPHAECGKYWVIGFHVDAPNMITEGPGILHAMLVDSDAGVSQEVLTPYPWKKAWFGLCVKFSPDGRLFAMTSRKTVDILNFDRATGQFTPHSRIADDSGDDTTWGSAYGVEFSPNGQHLYFTLYYRGDVRRHTIGAPSTTPIPYSATALLGNWPLDGRGSFNVGALQLGPNGKIYGAKVSQPGLFEIAQPDSPLAGGVLLDMTAKQAGGAPLILNDMADLGLPTFVRMTRDCDETCSDIAAEVNAELIGKNAELYNQMAHCCDHDGPAGENPGNSDGTFGPAPSPPTPDGPPLCQSLDLPEITPWTSIRWGDSQCDCIEGDDTEIMNLTVCNPYSNVTLANLTIHRLEVTNEDGSAVPPLPNGDPSIQLVPVGPYCFDDIGPCTCVSREFVLRLRGAPGRRYRILVRGICFDACFHGDTEACFVFDVCKD